MKILFAGGSGRGKSSLINALLQEEDELCYVDEGASTNMLSLITYAEEEKLEAFLEDRKGRLGHYVNTLDRFEIDEYTTEEGNPNNFRGAKLLRLAVPNALLQGGLQLMDSPGLENFRPEHPDTMAALLCWADRLVFVTDCLEPLSETELSWLCRFRHFCPEVLLVHTKKNLAENAEAVMAENQKRLASMGEVPPMLCLSAGEPSLLLAEIQKEGEQDKDCEEDTAALQAFLAGKKQELSARIEESVDGWTAEGVRGEDGAALLCQVNTRLLETMAALSHYVGKERAWQLMGLVTGGAAQVLAGAEQGTDTPDLLSETENCRLSLLRYGDGDGNHIRKTLLQYEEKLFFALEKQIENTKNRQN